MQVNLLQCRFILTSCTVILVRCKILIIVPSHQNKRNGYVVDNGNMNRLEIIVIHILEIYV